MNSIGVLGSLSCPKTRLIQPLLWNLGAANACKHAAKLDEGYDRTRIETGRKVKCYESSQS